MTQDVARLLAVNAVYVAVGVAVLVVAGLIGSRRALAGWWPLAPLLGMATTGIGASSLVLLGISARGAVAVVAAAAAVAAGTALLRGRPARDARRPRPVTWLLPALALLVAALPAFLVRPLVDWDAWAIWGLKAKALALLGSDADTFLTSHAYAGSQIDYPLLVPTLEAAVWPSGDPALVAHLQMWLIGAAGLLALWSVLTLHVPAPMAALGLLLVVTSPAFCTQLMTGYADIPVAVFSAVGLALVAGWLVQAQPAVLPLAAVFLGAAGLSKNEGLFVIVAAAFAVLAAGLATRGLRRMVPALATLAAAVAVTLPWQLYVATHGLRTALYETSTLLDPGELSERSDRLLPSLDALLGSLVSPLEWAFVAPLFFLVVVLACFNGGRRLAVFGGVWATLVAAELLVAYWIANTPLEWHLETSVDRVVAPLAVGMSALIPLLGAEGGRESAVARESPPIV